MPRSVFVIGIGNELRGDDAAGLIVARRLAEQPTADGVRVRAHDGEAIDLLELWEGADAVVLVDTVRSGSAPGTVHRIDASDAAIPAALARTSSHTIDAAGVIELARTLGRLPTTVIVYGIEGSRFTAGDELGSELAGALDALAEAVRREASELAA